jgi:hypothetical protein
LNYRTRSKESNKKYRKASTENLGQSSIEWNNFIKENNISNEIGRYLNLI